MAKKTLHDYQLDAVEQVRQHIREGRTRVMLCAPTGAGKTVIGTHLVDRAERLQTRAMFIVDRVSLIDQTSAEFDAWGIDHGVIQGDHWRYRRDRRIQIASVQTLQNRIWHESDLIIVDEAHSQYKLIQQKMKEFPDLVWVGLSATPFTKGLGRYYNGLVNAAVTVDLIEKKRLSPYRIFAPSEPDMKGAKVSAGEWTQKEAASRSMPIVGDVVQQYLKHAYGRKFICFGSTVAHCEEIQKQFLSAGIRTEVYSYRGTGVEKADMVQDFRAPNSPIQGLISVSALAKGFDVPSVSCVIICRPLRKSFAEHVQMVGRGLRWDPADPNKECIILDHAGNTVRFGDRMDEFFHEGAKELDDGKRPNKKKKSRDGDEEPRMRKCDKCAHVHPTSPTCPNCGYEYPKPVIEHEDGELTELGATARALPAESMRDWYLQLKGIQQGRGYKPGWTAHKFKARFGTWPQRSWEGMPSEPASVEVLKFVQSQTIRWAKSKKKWKGVRK